MLGIHRNPNWKEFLRSCESFLRKSQFSTLTARIEKLTKWHFWSRAWNSKILLVKRLLLKHYEDDIYNNIAKKSQGLPNPWFRSVKVENWDFLKKDSQDFKNSFQFRFPWIPLVSKIRSCLFFDIYNCKKPLWLLCIYIWNASKKTGSYTGCFIALPTHVSVWHTVFSQWYKVSMETNLFWIWKF